MLCAIICNARSFAAIAKWARRCSQTILKRLWCRVNPNSQLYAPPSEPTIRRFLRKVDADSVGQAFCGWLQSILDTTLPVAGDGKTYYLSASAATHSLSDSVWVSITATSGYSSSVAYSLGSGDGTKLVYAWFKDASGIISSSASAVITLDTSVPSITIHQSYI